MVFQIINDRNGRFVLWRAGVSRPTLVIQVPSRESPMSEGVRQCRTCGQVLPLTRDFFGQTPSGGFRKQCRECKNRYNAEWAASRPDLVSERWARQNRRRARAGFRWTDSDIEQLRLELKGKCAYCGNELNGGGEVDHKISLERGGTNHIGNLTLACLPCNRAKGARSDDEFFAWRRARGLICRED